MRGLSLVDERLAQLDALEESANRYREIAEYCLRDVVATVKLYDVWKGRLAGIK